MDNVIYIIEYDRYDKACGKYGDETPKHRKYFYSREERQDFLDLYNRITKDDFYYDNIETYYVMDYKSNDLDVGNVMINAL